MGEGREVVVAPPGCLIMFSIPRSTPAIYWMSHCWWGVATRRQASAAKLSRNRSDPHTVTAQAAVWFCHAAPGCGMHNEADMPALTCSVVKQPVLWL